MEVVFISSHDGDEVEAFENGNCWFGSCLSSFVTTKKSATVPFNFDTVRISSCSNGRTLFLNGGSYTAANASPEGLLLICPIQSAGSPDGWCVLRSEEQGFSVTQHGATPSCDAPFRTAIVFNNVSFRGDELLDDDSIQDRVLPVESAAGALHRAGRLVHVHAAGMRGKARRKIRL
jgi:hypothetical protein